MSRLVELIYRYGSKKKQFDVPARTERRLRANVKRGAKFLDKALPTWYDKKHIRLSNLVLEDACRCVYGQLEDTTEMADLSAIDTINDALNQLNIYSGKDVISASFGAEGIVDMFQSEDLGYSIDDDSWDELRRRVYGDEEYDLWDDRVSDAGYAVLQDEWVKQIKQRRAAATV